MRLSADAGQAGSPPGRSDRRQFQPDPLWTCQHDGVVRVVAFGPDRFAFGIVHAGLDAMGRVSVLIVGLAYLAS